MKSNGDQNDFDSDFDSNLNQDSLADQHEDGLIYCTDSNYLTQSQFDCSDCATNVGQFTLACAPDPFDSLKTDHIPDAMSEDARARYRCGIFLDTRSLRL